jgi:PAS domain-containing protein
LQWWVLNDRRALLAVASDKLASKVLVAQIAKRLDLDIRVPETLWVGTDVRELQAIADQLPTRWVLKPNSSSGRVRMVDSALTPIDWNELVHVGTGWMKDDEEAGVFGHWGYSQARRLLIAEERVGTGDAPPTDLRTQIFSGSAHRFDWSSDYGTPRHRVACYAEDLATRFFSGEAVEIPMGEHTLINEMTEQQRSRIRTSMNTIGSGTDYLRIDGYFEGGQYWFGELTAYTEGGLGIFSKPLDEAAGDIWQLPDLSAPDPREAEWRALLEGIPKGTLQE